MREALIDAFDFEWTNKNIMYGSYERTQSIFENSPMKANGKPSEAELALLEPFRGKVPDEVFGEPYRAAGDRRLGPATAAGCGTPRNCSTQAGCAAQERQARSCRTARRSRSNS